MTKTNPTPLGDSWANSIGSLNQAERTRILSSLTPAEVEKLEYTWEFWARPDQLPPKEAQGGGPWRTALWLAGRGYGKTRTGAEWVRAKIETGNFGRVALVGPTASDVRDVMVLGESGILNICPPWNRPVYQSTKRRIVWPNGAYAMLFSAEESDRLRGPQHDAAWCDELCAWKNPATWDMLLFTLRLGQNPQCVVTTTPKPIAILRELVEAPSTAIVKGSTFDNASNLAPEFIKSIRAKYEGSRLGRQELFAEILDDTPGALWSYDILEKQKKTAPEDMQRIVVAVDPAMTSGDSADETGIVVVGRDAHGQAYVLEDASVHGSADEWGRASVAAYYRWKADRIVVEINQGGDLVERVIRTVDSSVAIKTVRATRGKVVRAEPVAALYEQGKVWHAAVFEELERQMTMFTTDFDPLKMGYSPDRVDALVGGLTELMVELQTDGIIAYYAEQAKIVKAQREGSRG